MGATTCDMPGLTGPEVEKLYGEGREWLAESEVTPRKKVRRDWHHHSRALRRRLMGQGGIAGCRDDSWAQESFPAVVNFFARGCGRFAHG
jgi:hypothetical protein